MLALKFPLGEGATLAYGGRDHDFRVVLADPYTIVIAFDGTLAMIHRERTADLPGTLSAVRYSRWQNGGPRLAFDLHPECILTRYGALRRERAAS